MEEDVNVRKKAELILGGAVRLPESFVFPFRVSRSTAGPGAGASSAVFSFYGHRVKKSISYDEGEFILSENEGRLSLMRNGERFLDEVTIEPVVFHSPEQAFFNLDQRCMYHCAFCVSPLLGSDLNKMLSDDDIVRLTKGAMRGHKVVSVSLTSGVVGSIDETVDRFVSCVSNLRKEFPGLPIGVEPYVSKKEHVRALKEAGATEIKLNIQSPNREIFEKICPELDYENILGLLLYSADIFGRGKVTSNMIFGMGETDRELENMFGFLCSKRIMPTMRSLRINSMNHDALVSAIGEQPPVTPERMIMLAKMQKRILSEYGLDTRDCRTMCIECGCCDIVPFRDL